VGLRKHLDTIVVSPATLVLVSALAPEPVNSVHRPLRERVGERVAQLYRSSPDVNRLPTSAHLQVVVAVSPLAGPSALTLAGVSYTWFPPHLVLRGPSLDVLHMAVSLWRPDTPKSRWGSFDAALTTAIRLDGIAATHRLCSR
jgi:hypothetical protein